MTQQPPRYVDEATVLGKCQECKESEAEVALNPTSAFSIFSKVVFKPCQHMPACLSCAANLAGCPQCGSEVEEKILKPGFALSLLSNIKFTAHL